MAEGRPDGRARRALVVAALILASGWAATAFLVLPLRSELRARAERSFHDDLIGGARGVGSLVAGMRDVAAEVARAVQSRDLLAAHVRGEGSLASVAAAARPELEAALRRFPGLLGISRHGPHGAVVTQVGRPIPTSPWPVPARLLDRAPQATIVQLGNRSFLAVSTPIQSAAGERLGTDVLLYDTDPLENLLARVPEYAAGDRFILGARERERWWDLLLPASGDGSNAIAEGSALGTAMEAAAKGSSGLLRPADGEARASLLAYGRVPGQPWVLVLAADRGQLYRDASQGVARASAPGLLVSVLLAVVGWGLASGRLATVFSRRAWSRAHRRAA